jgi:hypothetical protein
MRIVAITGALMAFVGAMSGTTLQQLSLDDMTRKSSEIVRGKVVCTGVALRGATLYTNFRVQVSEQWKGAPSSQLDFAVPGGFGNGIRQTYAGAPAIADGQELILFLWTSKSGLRQVIGLSQGLFNLSQVSNSEPFVTRGTATEHMVDANGRDVHDTDFAMPLSDFRARVTTTLTGRSQ